MRVIIVPSDSFVSVDGVFHLVDLSLMAPNIHAIQWYGEVGEIEWKDNKGRMIENELITSLDDYAWVIDAWNEKQSQALEAQQNKAPAATITSLNDVIPNTRPIST